MNIRHSYQQLKTIDFSGVRPIKTFTKKHRYAIIGHVKND